MKKKILLIGVLMSLFVAKIAAQMPVGTWQTYFNYSQAKIVVSVGQNTVFCASDQGLFSVNIPDNEINTYSKLDGLAENGISAMAYFYQNPSLSAYLVLGYQSGNIDVLEWDKNKAAIKKIYNVPILKDSQVLPASKTINDIQLFDKVGLLALATDYSVSILNLKDFTIKETYRNIGPNGKSLKVNKLLINDAFYLATDQGIFKANLRPETNLQYFGNWQPYALFNQNIEGVYQGNQNELLAYSVNSKSIFSLQNNTTTLLRNLSPNQKLVNGLISEKGKIEKYALGKWQIFNSLLFEIPQMAVLVNDKLWVADAKNGLLFGQNNSFSTKNPSESDAYFKVRKDSVLIDDNGFNWSKLGYYQGILVSDSKTNRRVVLGTSQGQGALPSSNVLSIIADRKGQIWVGTDRGVAVFDSPNLAFGNINAYRPVIDRRYLLANETATTIAVDGGNKKWIGTTNGLFLFSADGSEQILYFNEKNSPLPSSQITALEMTTTGELFIKTPRGIVSYRGDASEPNENLNTVKIYPNPVRPTDTGLVVIDGLIDNCIVKISNAAGQAVFEAKANGGTVSWNASLTGAGIYFVLMADAKGQETQVGKVAVIK